MIYIYVKKEKKTNLFIQVTDIFFIMALCFGTLLTAMIFKGKTIVEIDYSVYWLTLVVITVGLISYLYVILKYSNEELKKVVKSIYKEHDEVKMTGGIR